MPCQKIIGIIFIRHTRKSLVLYLYALPWKIIDIISIAMPCQKIIGIIFICHTRKSLVLYSHMQYYRKSLVLY